MKKTHTGGVQQSDLEWSYISEYNAMLLEEIKDHDMIEKEATNDDRVAEAAKQINEDIWLLWIKRKSILYLSHQ